MPVTIAARIYRSLPLFIFLFSLSLSLSFLLAHSLSLSPSLPLSFPHSLLPLSRHLLSLSLSYLHDTMRGARACMYTRTRTHAHARALSLSSWLFPSFFFPFVMLLYRFNGFSRFFDNTPRSPRSRTYRRNVDN